MIEHPVSDHALVRYMERVLELDVDGMRDFILTKDIKAAMSTGAKSASIGEFKYIFKNNKLVTIHGRSREDG
ncbi:hypothetical protein [uncultured Kiloniella sp.]|uniref:hypothetical protein n=1 Tax=uncultured Kiloniella sp. TaxID=1133091 RepID=UPI00262AAAA4|nr:hypothetical protein [uncultured Kiloniella sp.]